MKQTKLILTRTALALFILFMAQSAWAAPHEYKWNDYKVKIGGVELGVNDNGLGDAKTYTTTYTGEALTPIVEVYCKKGEDYRLVTSLVTIEYSNNVYARHSTAFGEGNDSKEATVTISIKDEYKDLFDKGAGNHSVDLNQPIQKHFVIKKANAVKITAAPKQDGESREYNGKPWTIDDLVFSGVPEGHTVTGVEATFKDTNEENVGNVGTYELTLSAAESGVQIKLGDATVNDCFESIELTPYDQNLAIVAKQITITAKDQTIFSGQDIATGTSQVTVTPAVAEGDVLTAITLAAGEDEGNPVIIPSEAEIRIGGDTGDEVTENYEIKYVNGKLTKVGDEVNVIVTITGHTGTFEYDDEEHTVSGYEYSISYPEGYDGAVYSPTNISFTGEAKVSLAGVGTKAMGLQASDFDNQNEEFKVVFVVIDGSITINKAKVTVAIVGKKLSIAYNGDTQTISGYTPTADNKIYDVTTYIKYNGTETEPEPTATGKDAGKYWMEINAENFENTNENFNVKFLVPKDGDGYLEILPIDATVTIKGKTSTKVYDGKEHTVQNWKATASTDLYNVDNDFEYHGEVDPEGNAFATLTDVLVNGETGEVLKKYMGLDEEAFVNINPNFSKVTFVVTDGWQEVTKRPVTITITGNVAKFEYDAEEHVVVQGEIEISDELYENQALASSESFYGPIGGTPSYTATAKRTEIGRTYMGMKAEDWENNNTNYDVTFVVTDGYVEISYHVASLADDTDNTTTIADIVADYEGMADVTLADRTLYKDGSWNTICLPFDVDIEDSPLAGADVRQLTGASYEEGTLTLEFTAVTEIKAGEPYIIKWEEGNDLVNPVFKGVEVVGPGLSEARFDIGEEMALTFKGTYAPVKYTSENKSILLVGDNSALYYPQAGAFTNPQRAFFELEGIEVGDVESNAIGLRFGDATRINMQTTAADAVYYDLSGRRVNGQPAEAGIYIVNGQKVMIK